jgi:hypothetical protein
VSAVATEDRLDRGPRRHLEAGRLFEPAGSTLEDLVLRAWEDLAARGDAECPVCRGRLTADGCADCGSELS